MRTVSLSFLVNHDNERSMDRASHQWNDNYIIHLGTRIFFLPLTFYRWSKGLAYFSAYFFPGITHVVFSGSLRRWVDDEKLCESREITSFQVCIHAFFWWYWRTSRRPHFPFVCIQDHNINPKLVWDKTLGCLPSDFRHFPKWHKFFAEKKTLTQIKSWFFFWGTILHP